ncbi:hypothetical protein [Candidatus Mycolicibacterium alkanivorans]|uniref:Transposase n=1 Tax=Candidatus Mycolicibacterium alkanivorans TaxID=2954114 RepID=A0ABS9YQ78_9MYCO|nr:hypothetical protein [Candidatus Mycolicibacterium alkanivorans]MCI4673446.1 hypothetical protein [Candidatus Mycolicibacterium alkanivorans]
MTDVIVEEKVLEAPDGQGVVGLDDLDEQLIGQLVDRARSEGLRLTGEDGLLGLLDHAVDAGGTLRRACHELGLGEVRAHR